MTAVNTRKGTMPGERDNMGKISRLKHSGEVYQLIASLKRRRRNRVRRIKILTYSALLLYRERH